MGCHGPSARYANTTQPTLPSARQALIVSKKADCGHNSWIERSKKSQPSCLDCSLIERTPKRLQPSSHIVSGWIDSLLSRALSNHYQPISAHKAVEEE